VVKVLLASELSSKFNKLSSWHAALDWHGDCETPAGRIVRPGVQNAAERPEAEMNNA
jgi:hypothetical protein